jgi:hypothetical protein
VAKEAKPALAINHDGSPAGRIRPVVDERRFDGVTGDRVGRQGIRGARGCSADRRGSKRKDRVTQTPLW